jgi:hypothetical protein
MKRIVFVLLFLALAITAGAQSPQEITLKDSEVRAIDLGPIQSKLLTHEGFQHAPGMIGATIWGVYFLNIGKEDYKIPSQSDVDLFCVEPLDIYFRNKQVALMVVIANYDTDAHSLPLRWEITGSKNLVVNTKKMIPSRRVMLYFILRPLINDVGSYQIKIKAYQPMPGVPAPGQVIDEMFTRFLINTFIG